METLRNLQLIHGDTAYLLDMEIGDTFKAVYKGKRKLTDPAEAAVPCPTCDNTPVVKWLLIRWYGVPKPKRWFTAAPADGWKGCGCPVKTKAAWNALKYALRMIREA